MAFKFLFKKDKKGNPGLLAEKAQELENLFLIQDEIPESFAVQKGMEYLKRERNKPDVEIDVTYPVKPPFAFINIVFSKEDENLVYLVKEPALTDDEHKILSAIKEKMELTMDNEGLPIAEETALGESVELERYLKKKFDEITYLYEIGVPASRKDVLLYQLNKNLLGLGKIDPLIKDPFVEDIGCNGPYVPLYVYHRVFGSMKTNVRYQSEIELNRFVLKLAQVSGKHISVYQPILDATLSDGSRANLTLGSEVTRKGSTFTIRKFSYDPISPIDIIRFESVSYLQLAYFWLLIEHRKSIIISGGTASGKTTLLNALCMFIKPADKIVSIEDTAEIHIEHENWIQSITRTGFGMGVSGISGISGISGDFNRPGDINLYDLLVAALRQRPEYIIVGEVRGREAFTLFQAISIGHASMSTVHAGSMNELIYRVENEPLNVPRALFQGLDIAVFIGQVTVNEKHVRRVKEITEILEVERETENLLTNTVFTWNPREDNFKFSERSFTMEEIARESGQDITHLYEELRNKENYLRLMDKKNVVYYRDVCHAINDYYVDSESAIRKLNKR